MNQEKERWIDEVLNSTTGMQGAEPRRDLYGQLSSRLSKTLPAARHIPLSVVSAAAACLLVLFGLNITLVENYAQAETEVVSDEGGSVQDIIDYYELGGNSVGL